MYTLISHHRFSFSNEQNSNRFNGHWVVTVRTKLGSLETSIMMGKGAQFFKFRFSYCMPFLIIFHLQKDKKKASHSVPLGIQGNWEEYQGMCGM